MVAKHFVFRESGINVNLPERENRVECICKTTVFWKELTGMRG